MTPRFSIAVEGHYDLGIEEVWPDGDAPDNPTVEDVRTVMEKCGSKARVLADWELTYDLRVDVYAAGQHVEVWAPKVGATDTGTP